MTGRLLGWMKDLETHSDSDTHPHRLPVQWGKGTSDMRSCLGAWCTHPRSEEQLAAPVSTAAAAAATIAVYGNVCPGLLGQARWAMALVEAECCSELGVGAVCIPVGRGGH